MRVIARMSNIYYRPRHVGRRSGEQSERVVRLNATVDVYNERVRGNGVRLACVDEGGDRRRQLPDSEFRKLS